MRRQRRREMPTNRRRQEFREGRRHAAVRDRNSGPTDGKQSGRGGQGGFSDVGSRRRVFEPIPGKADTWRVRPRCPPRLPTLPSKPRDGRAEPAAGFRIRRAIPRLPRVCSARGHDCWKTAAVRLRAYDNPVKSNGPAG
jgi:hypothetical protein